MNYKAITLAALAGAATLFVMGYLVYGIGGVANYMFDGPGSSSMKTDPSMGVIGLLELSTALLISIVYSHWATIKTFMTGAKNGLWMGALLALIVMLDYFAMTDVTSVQGVLIYMVTHALVVGLAAGVIGLVLGKVK